MAEESAKLLPKDSATSSENLSDPEAAPLTASSEEQSVHGSTSSKSDASKSKTDESVATSKDLPRYTSYIQTFIPESKEPSVPAVNRDEIAQISLKRATSKALKLLSQWKWFYLLLFVCSLILILLPLYEYGYLISVKDWAWYTFISLFGMFVFIFAAFVILLVLELRAQNQRVEAVFGTRRGPSSTSARSVPGPSTTRTGSVPGPSIASQKPVPEPSTSSGKSVPSTSSGKLAPVPSTASEKTVPGPSTSPPEELQETDIAVRHRHVSGDVRETTV